jgi:hypothetical protein
MDTCFIRLTSDSPLCRLCFDLSKAAVESKVDNVLTRDVFPESTWPKIPTFTFKTSSGVGVGAFTAADVDDEDASFSGMFVECIDCSTI